MTIKTIAGPYKTRAEAEDQPGAHLMTIGIICVIRLVNGRETVLPLANQRSFKEWTGCFSLIA